MQEWVRPIINQLLYMYNGSFKTSGPWPLPWETQATDGLNELLELQKCDWSPDLLGGASQGLRPVPEKFLIYGVEVHPSLSSLPLLTSHLTHAIYRGWAGGGYLHQAM